ncbi:MAG: peptidoglycan DD-metalloendopeptidase family protein [Bacteroidales bacterium]|jgi:septal ring factor EnvC (AmiA/AmiB activator)|nr:peptidoglycan DD-metalloendopeptidase family protein [Bacteroidales bacterium]
MAVINKYVIIVIILCGFQWTINAQDRNRLEKEKAKLEKEIANINAILKETLKTKKISASELVVLKKKIAQRQQLIQNITTQTNMLKGEINTTQQSISDLQHQIIALKSSYAQMLRYAQKNKTSMDKFTFIFSSKDYTEAYRRYVFFRQFGEVQKQKIEQIKQKTRELNIKTNELELKKNNQEYLLATEQKNKEELYKEQKNKEQTLTSIKKQEKQYQKQLKEKEAKRKKLQQQIDNAIAAEIRKQKALAEKRKAAEKKIEKQTTTTQKTTDKVKNNKYVIATTVEDIALADNFAASKGKLPYPCDNGIVVSTYGMHSHPDIKGVMVENRGIDIRLPKGSSVRSVFDGVVVKVFKEPHGNMGIIIRHGEYMTVYTSLKVVSVNEGDKVITRQVIGTIATNADGQSEMNFQIWKGYENVNPALWLR